ncbi:MAG: hypothetical protein IAF94_13360 [Pirellulaceae bacterium]|nr:hypothetical protein [Pirellulaceae bacterium]
MKDERSTSKGHKEPPRPSHIPDYFVWCPDIRCWDAPPQPEGSGWDVEVWAREFEEKWKDHIPTKGLITRDMLLAAGALNLNPRGRRKSRKDGSPRQLDLFADQAGDEKELPAEADEEEESGDE